VFAVLCWREERRKGEEGEGEEQVSDRVREREGGRTPETAQMSFGDIIDNRAQLSPAHLYIIKRITCERESVCVRLSHARIEISY